MSFKLYGIVPPLVTPLNADETIDEAGLERQLNRMIEAGVHGIYYLGSTGEQPALRDVEKVKALKLGVRVAAGRTPLIVGTMASSTARAIDNIRAAEDAGADAVAVTPPHYYNSAGVEEQIAHYQACVDATQLPLVVYNIPSTTKVMLSAETMARIAEIPGVVGVKDSSSDFTHFLKLLSYLRGNEKIGVLIGAPMLAGAAMLYGADGAVPGIANLCPKTMMDLYAAAQAGDTAKVVGLQERVQKLMSIQSFGPPVACFKTALELMGICHCYTTAPIQCLPEAKRTAIACILRELELL